MKTQIVYLLTISALGFASCNKKPSVSFSASNKEPLIDEEITFTNSTSNGESYVWDFGDGTSSTEQSPKHAYDKEGSYDVTLTSYSKGKKNWNSSAEKITVQHPTALFTGKIDNAETKIYAGVKGASASFGVDEFFLPGTRNVTYRAKVGGGENVEEILVLMGVLPVPDTYTLAETAPLFHAAVRVMEYDFSTTAGLTISYKASNGVVWSTDAGIADQAGSKIIVTWTENSTQGSTATENFKAHFNCKLYNGLGQSKTITNGVVELAFGNM